MVGLDVEWKPNTSGEQNPASIFQVCFIVCLDSLRAAADFADLQACLFTIISKVLLSTRIVIDGTAQSIRLCCCGYDMCRYHDKQHEQYKTLCKPALPLADVMMHCAVWTMYSLVPSGIRTAGVLRKAPVLLRAGSNAFSGPAV